MHEREKIREVRLLILERTILYNKLVEREIYQRISRTKPEGLEKLGKQQPMVITIIGTMEEIIPSYLGLCMNLDRSSLSRMIDSLEKKGVVRRKTDPEDRRKVLISLTEKGNRYYEIILEIMEEVNDIILGVLDEEDIRMYEEGLKTEVNLLRKIDSKMEERE